VALVFDAAPHEQQEGRRVVGLACSSFAASKSAATPASSFKALTPRRGPSLPFGAWRAAGEMDELHGS